MTKKATEQGEKQGKPNNRKLPPIEHRFKPGQSGNPGGRPKKKPITQMFEEMLASDEDFDAIKTAMRKVFFEKSGIAKVMLLREAAERIEGKVTQPIEANVNVSLADAIAEARKRAGK